MAFTYVATVLPVVGKPYKVSSGPADTQAHAKAEVAAILKTVVGVQINHISVTQDLDVTAEALTLADVTHRYEDAVINLRKAGTLAGTFKTRFKRVNNMDVAYADFTDSHLVDQTNADIQAIRDSYQDSSGGTGYSFNPTDPSFFDN
jgi:hypothetical protein